MKLPQVQFCGCGRPYDHTATSGLLLEVPQIQFIVPSEDIPVVQQRRVRVQFSALGLPFMAVMAAMKGFRSF